MSTTPLKKLNEVVAGLLQAQSFTASIGAATNDTVWASAAPNLLNGNAILILPGPAITQVVLKASAMVINVPLSGMLEVSVGSDTPINTTVTLPPGARTDGTNYFFSSFSTWNETPVLLANRFNHIYIVFDVSKTNNLAIGVIANHSVSDPGSSPLSNIGVTVSARQAVCYVDNVGNVTLLQTFPTIFNSIASVPEDSAPSFADWYGNATLTPTNTMVVQFTFPAGTATGEVGEFSINIGTSVVGFLAVSPQLLKDADVPIVLKWTLMVGEPGAFLP